MNRRPKTQDALMGLQILKKTIAIIDYFRTLNPHLIWYIENPRGMMRKMNSFDVLPHIRQTVIWTNNYDWSPRPACKNGMSCHISAPRGSRTGTQGLKGSYVRSQIPYELCKEIVLNSVK
jgi:hypothetical protein